MKRRQFLYQVPALAAGILPLPALSAAPQWPQRTIKLLVPFLPGSAVDVIARAIAPGLSSRLNVPVIVENLPGAGGIIGGLALKRAAPDGYSIGVLANSHTINVHTFRRPPFDPATDFVPVTALSGSPSVLVVTQSSPYHSVTDLLAAMRMKPGELNYASSGKGSIAHLGGEMLLRYSETKATHIPYKGAPEMVTSVLSGETHFGMPPLASALPFLRRGQLRVLAVSAEKRIEAIRDVPTMRETIKNDFVLDNWSGLFLPSGTPQPIVERLFAEVREVIQQETVTDLLKRLASETRLSKSPEAFRKYVRDEFVRYGKLMEDIGMDREKV